MPDRASSSVGARVILIVVAVAVPLVPLAFWLYELVPMMPAPLQSFPFALYLIARAFALTGFVLMFYQFVLSARLPFLESVFKRPKLMGTHRTVGKVGFILMLLHGVILLATEPVLYTEKTLGLVALILLTTGVTAAWFFKPLKLSLKTWRAVHLVAYLVFPLVFIHAISLGSTVLGYEPVYWLFVVLFAGYCLIVVYRVVRLVRARGSSPGARTASAQ